jgi:hypothetical protein
MTMDSIRSGRQSLPGGLKMIMVDGAVYMNMPLLTQISGGKPWMKFSEQDLRKGGADFQQFAREGDLLDLRMVTKTMTAAKDTTKVGTETVNGVRTTHYTGSFSQRDALAGLGPAEREQANEFFGTESGKITFDLWVDGRQLPRKLDMTSAAHGTRVMEMTMAFSGFGQPVHITAPPADQVGPLPPDLVD